MYGCAVSCRYARWCDRYINPTGLISFLEIELNWSGIPCLSNIFVFSDKNLTTTARLVVAFQRAVFMLKMLVNLNCRRTRAKSRPSPMTIAAIIPKKILLF